MAVRCKRVGRIALLAFSFVRVLVTVMDCLVGAMQEDAQAPRTRSCVRAARTICAITAARRPLGSGAAAATAAASDEPSQHGDGIPEKFPRKELRAMRGATLMSKDNVTYNWRCLRKKCEYIKR